MSKTNKNVIGFAIAILCLLIIAYINHFNNGFHFDDFHAIVNNIFIRDLKNIPSFFIDPKMFSADPSHWGLRSLVTTSLAIDYWLGNGLDPFYFQLSTFIWHVGLCVILFFLFRKILGASFDYNWASYLAIVAVSWYALHKVNAETLNYIISRSDVLSSFMVVSSLFIYVNWPSKRKYFIYIIPAFLGVFAKEIMPVLIIILFFYIWLFEKKHSIAGLFHKDNLKSLGQTLIRVAPLVVVIVITQIYTLSRISSIPGITNPLLPYVLTQTFVWVHYFIAFFIPANLSADSDWTIIKNAFDERIIIGCIFVTSLVITVFRTSMKDETKPVAFGLIWFAAALLPTSLAPFAEVTNDHRMYFPFIGLSLSVVTYAGVLLRRYKVIEKSKFAISAVLTVFLSMLLLNAYGVSQRNKVWHDEGSLWRDVTIQSPGNGRGLMNYGLTLMDKRNYFLADHYFKMAKQLDPTYNLLYINVAILDDRLNKPVEAEKNFLFAIDLDPKFFDSYYYYAQSLLRNGKPEKARPIAEKALVLNPYSEKTLDMLMDIYDEMGFWDLVTKTAHSKLTIASSDHTAIVYLQAARDHHEIVKDEEGNVPTTEADYLWLSLRCYNKGLFQKCIAACNEALKMNPQDADAYCNIGAAYNKLNRWGDAVAALKKALKFNPDHALATGNLKLAESKLNNH